MKLDIGQDVVVETAGGSVLRGRVSCASPDEVYLASPDGLWPVRREAIVSASPATAPPAG